MLKLNHFIPSVLLSAAMVGLSAYSMPVSADFSTDYLSSRSGAPVTNSGGECWRTRAWDQSSLPCPPPAVVIEEAPHTIVFDIDDASFFGFDEVTLSDAAKADLDMIIEAVKDARLIHGVSVTGHADRIGPKPYNRELAKARAEAVKRYLVSKGVMPSRIQTFGDGSSDPLVKCPGIENQQKLIDCLAPNRRVEVEAVLAETVDVETITIIESHL